MATTPNFTKSGTKSTSVVKLEQTVFGVEPKNHVLLKQAYLMYMANGRENLAKTLKRGEVRGGGKKPWKQKGTGRARFGSIRVPLWRGGGIIFGPLGKENYSKQMTLSAKRVAIRQALTLKAKAGNMIIIEDISFKDAKTSSAKALFEKIGAKGRVLIAVENKTPEIERATANLKHAEVVQANYLNTYSIINADTLIITSKALEIINTWLGIPKREAVPKAKKDTK